IDSIKAKIKQIAPGMPRQTLADGTESQLKIVPFYDRGHLIKETLGTLESALSLEILITILVVVIMVMNLRASILVSGLLPVAVLACFILMRYFHVDANIVALSGIAIAIGTMVDMGIVLVENMQRRLAEAPPGHSQRDTILNATHEVAGAVLTAVLTTIISFIPVFTMEAAEGKLFRPLAFTKTFALVAAILLALMVLPALAHFSTRLNLSSFRKMGSEKLAWAGGIFCIILLLLNSSWLGPILLILAVFAGFQILDYLLETKLPPQWAGRRNLLYVVVAALGVWWLLTKEWLPLGPESSFAINLLFVGLIAGILLGIFLVIIHWYERILSWCLDHKKLFLLFPLMLLLFGMLVWQGFPKVFSPLSKGMAWLGADVEDSRPWKRMAGVFPGIGKEFMPALDEGDFLLMPSTMPHAGTAETRRLLKELDMAVSSIPEVEMVVGKAGRVASALDPAPLSMFENIIRYKSEYKVDEEGRRLRFKVDKEGQFLKDEFGMLIPDAQGKYFRQWREQIRSPDDIWAEVAKVSKFPGLTTAPRLQPIETRLLMLQTGMRAPMGIKVKGPHLDSIQQFAEALADALRQVPQVRAEAVFADRIMGKPYMQLEIDRQRIERYGLRIADVQRWISIAIGGETLTHTIEGRERYAVRLRYPRELRDSPEAISRILIDAPGGQRVPLGQLVDITFSTGPQMIRSEDTFLTGYVLFDKNKGHAESDVVEAANAHIQKEIAAGRLRVPTGISYAFTGSYENQIRADKRLALVLPLVLGIIFLILYFQFRSVPLTFMVFSGIAVAFAGGFLMIWLYGQPWFLNFSFLGANLHQLFNMDTINLSVAVWVGFIALFGIATDDGVVIATYLKQSFQGMKPSSVTEVRQAVIAAGQRRIRPCLMTTATTLLALLPILASQGKGADIMAPMAIPVFGGMAVELMTLFIVPVLYAWWHELQLKSQHDEKI
ncbi:MAG TPA: efflux RND transporter permease subunit, partial [Bacteroidetes bacterium]|nr:efflux RND transporter permease subunit [Bacteroidota bacterium]